ncbi:MAG TPA: hypothetical protein PLQ78_07450, partial [Flavipsychrobacter sp.]|nr:hypothetical protein [Flavipsychrobacter sp.]
RGSLGNIKDGDVISWNFYYSHQEFEKVDFVINNTNFLPSDTSFIGRPWNNYEIVYPIPNQYSITLTKNNRGLGQSTDSSKFGVFWAIGKNSYSILTSQNKPADWKDYYFQTTGNPCEDTHTDNVTIP